MAESIIIMSCLLGQIFLFAPDALKAVTSRPMLLLPNHHNLHTHKNDSSIKRADASTSRAWLRTVALWPDQKSHHTSRLLLLIRSHASTSRAWPGPLGRYESASQ